LVLTIGLTQSSLYDILVWAKLTTMNNPDMILFVGEALVGNESLDQLQKFNAALRTFSTEASPRGIDALVLTKFDVIQDKVGAAVSMTYITRCPILFLGTGQTYTDLKRVNVNTIVDCLIAS
jgi:signal recognition particle receptor subunit alpha